MKNIDSASSGHKNNFTQPPTVQNQNISGLNARTTVNLLKPASGPRPKSILKRVFFALLIVALILAGLILNRAANLTEKIFAGQKTTILGKVWEAIRGASGSVSLKGENKGQINILLLGIGGPGHEGPYLTDTMILAQIRPKNSEVAFVSIPRDLLAELPNNLGARKINAVFAEGIGRTKDWSVAGHWSRMATERLAGQTIPYFAVIDFEGFKKAVDKIDGLDIDVERQFTDAQFPDKNAGFLLPLTFEKGLVHMDGTRALQFARSRHGSNNEGSDFARSLRQQKVMKSFKDKVLKMNLITSIGRINSLLGIIADNFHTNLTPGEIFRLYNIAKEQNIHAFLSLNLGLETGLVCPAVQEETGAYILIPCEGQTAVDLQNFFKNAFALGKLVQEKAVVWLGDSAGEPGAFKKAENSLKQAGLTVWQLNYGKDDLPQTIIYPVNSKPAALEYIKNTLDAKIVTLPPPGVKIDNSKVDIIVILGKNN